MNPIRHALLTATIASLLGLGACSVPPAAPPSTALTAGVVVPITGNLTSPIVGSAMPSASQAADLSSGKWYVNLHTAANPGGEVRGQVSVRE